MRTKDRDYYACLTTGQLQEEINYGINVDWHELCIALSARLDKTKRTLMDYRADLAAERYDYDRGYED
jgi:hypothetical protein